MVRQNFRNGHCCAEQEVRVHCVFLTPNTRIVCADKSPFVKILLRLIFAYQGWQCHTVLVSYMYMPVTIKCFNSSPIELWQNHCSIHYSDNHRLFAIVVITIKFLTKWKLLILSLIWKLLLIMAHVTAVHLEKIILVLLLVQPDNCWIV